MAIIPLSMRLKAISVGSRLTSPQNVEVIDRFVGRLREAGAGAMAPALGDEMPSFVLPDIEGRLVGLSDLAGDGPLVVAFLRGHWCPYCSTVASSLGGLAAAAAGLGGRVVAICPEARPFALALSEAGRGRFAVLSDVDAGYALSLGLAVWMDDAMRELMTKLGEDLQLYNRSEGWILPIPATFVVDRARRVVFRDVNPDWRLRADPDAVLAAVRKAAA